MSFLLACSLALQLGSAPAASFTFPPPLYPLGNSQPRPASGAGNSPGAPFQPTQEIAHQDDFWSNMLVGDADHDGRQEIVVRYVSSGGPGGVQQVFFYEDDGSGHFTRVYQFPLQDGGLLAMGDVDGDGLTDLFYERALGICHHQFVRREASAPGGFPDHEVWAGPKQGNVVDFTAFLADSDGDGLKELVTSDNDLSCGGTALEVFESAPGDQMNLVLNLAIPGALGNPVVSDFDLDGRREIVVAEMFSAQLLAFEAVANDTWNPLPPVQHTFFNAYQCTLVERYSPTGAPLVYLAGQMASADYRLQCFARPAGAPALQLQHETQLPGLCGASIAQIASADLTGTRTPELLVDRICNGVAVYSLGPGGVPALIDLPSVPEAIEVVGTRKTAQHSGVIAVGRALTTSDPVGKTWLLRQ